MVKYYYAFLKNPDDWSLFFPDLQEEVHITDPRLREDAAITCLSAYLGAHKVRPKASAVILVINQTKRYLTNRGINWRDTFLDVYAVTKEN